MKKEETKQSYTVVDRRGTNKGSGEVCRVCGSDDVHTREYNKPTMACINYLRKQLSTKNPK